jgi:hypothetical protein
MLPSRTILGLGWARLVGGLALGALLLHLVGVTGEAQPPGAGDAKTVNGKVERFTTAPKGEVDGVVLDDGTWVHWPPHLQDRFKSLVERGDRIKVTGRMETGKKGDTRLEVQTVTNMRTNHSAENDGAPPRGGKGKQGGEVRTVQGTVERFTTAPKGEVDGLILNDGTWVHWPPHLQGRFSALVAKGDRVRAAGFWETGPKGDTKLEVSILTNLGSNKTSENPARPLPASSRLLPGKTGDVEERLQALEDKLDRLMIQIERLGGKK